MSKKSERAVQARAERDAQYREALGVEEIPDVLGAASSAGSSRGGRGRSRKRRH